MNDLIISKLDRCKALLAECHTAEDAKMISDIAEAARIYAKRIGAGIEVVNKAGEYKIRAERRLGEILSIPENKNKGMILNGKNSDGSFRRLPTGTTEDKLPTFAELNISKKLSSRAQRVAEIPEEILQKKIEAFLIYLPVVREDFGKFWKIFHFLRFFKYAIYRLSCKIFFFCNVLSSPAGQPYIERYSIPSLPKLA